MILFFHRREEESPSIVNASKKNPFERIPNLKFKKREEDDDTTTSIRRTSWRWSRRCQFNLPPCCGWKNFRWPTNFPLLCLVPATAVLRVFFLSSPPFHRFPTIFLASRNSHRTTCTSFHHLHRSSMV